MLKFGTGGWRAIIGEEFTKANVQLLTTAIMRKLKDDGDAACGFVIGYDRRFLSEEAARWAAEVVAGEGIHCRIINRAAPTPLIMYAVNLYNIPYGIAITASHNPAVYNGVKVFMRGGRDADEELTDEFEAYMAKITEADVHPEPYEDALAAGHIELVDPMNQYVDGILSAVNTVVIRQAALHVAIDPMFGVSKTALLEILATCRTEIDVIHERRDALFGGRLPAPNQETLAPLITHVRENNCDIGLATDGDADRLGVVDDKARFLHPNKILVLLYYYLLKYKGWHGPAVRNISTTHLLDRIADAFGEKCYEVPVGFKHVSSKMVETSAIIGGESSGGLTVRGHIQGKDGIYAGTLLVEMLAVSGRKVSELWDDIEKEFGRFEMAERAYHFSEKRKKEIFNTVMVEQKLPEFGTEIERVSYMDGCKVYFKNGGWVIARFSGTEPLLRIFAEMDSMLNADLIVDIFEKFLALQK